MKKAGTAVIVTLMLFLTGCMTYRDFPTEYVGKAPTTKPFKKLSYKINKSNTLSLGGGPGTLREVFRSKSPFMETEAVDEIPAKGLFCMVSVEPKDMSLGVIAAGYISYSTLTILPVWSTKDGYFLQYDLYVDGEKKQRFEYEITRKAAVWAGLLPIVWVNALTYSEEEAVQATANKFFKESEPLILAGQ
jgi:hypothetical protein